MRFLIRFFLLLGFSLNAGATDLATTPLSVGVRVDPNLMFVIDDSGSMRFEVMPESHIVGDARFIYPRSRGVYESGLGAGEYSNNVPTFDVDNVYNSYSRSPQANALYYNPSVTYLPWVKADGSRMAPANPNNAPHNPRRVTLGGRDLTAWTTQTADRWLACDSATADGPSQCYYQVECAFLFCSYRTHESFFPAVYYTYLGGGYGDTRNYRRVEIRPANAPFKGEGRANRSDCSNAGATEPSCSYSEEIQNFANWYTYYRSRTLAARAGIGEAFSQLGESVRVGFDTLNSNEDVSEGEVVAGVRAFSGEGREKFFERLYTHDVPADGTPLRLGLQRSGNYFAKQSEPWRDDPSSKQSTDFQSCRANYALLMTDGYWSGGNPDEIDNSDGESGPAIEGPGGQGYRYPANAPYSDAVSATLADVAMYYWKHDLREKLANNVPVNGQDPAFWQHMSTFGIGFGVEGNINPESAWQAVASGQEVNWPSAADFNSGDTKRADRARLDDLLHASVNGHGGFFNAGDPQSFVKGLDDVLGTIVAQDEASVVPVAVNGDSIDENSRMFTAGFRSTDWSGRFQGYQLLPGGKKKLLWDAEAMLRKQSPKERLLLTSQAGAGAKLTTQSSDLDINQIRWLKGVNVEGLRDRTPEGQKVPNLLGDIVNSAPFLLSPPQNDSRPGMVFVGANDGMLHGFSADTGKELFAYLPSELVTAPPGQAPPIASLMRPSYVHRYFVDGSAVARNVKIGGGPQAVVVGTMGGGGRSVFAIDVSNPGDIGPEAVLWEFSSPHLGEGVTRPAISRITYQGEPRWVALFGNGYNSVSGRASLFVVDLLSGDLIKRFDTKADRPQDPNGLAPPSATRWPDYKEVSTFAYAGDQQGNMWRFDLTDLHSNPVKLLQGNPSQPITAPPQLEFKPGNPSILMVLFGTGSFQFVGDRSDRSIQRLYGLEDRVSAGSEPVDAVSPNLVKQSVTINATLNDQAVRGVSNYPVAATQRGWYLELPEGERMVSMPSLPTGIYHQRALFSTLVPLFGQCSAGVNGYVYSLRIDTGGSGTRAFFDVNGDEEIDTGDNITDQAGNVQVVAGLQLGSGESQVTVNDPQNGEDVLAGTVGGNGGGTHTKASPGATGRQSWRQIFN
ncbi:pilus assembly protein [Modicisalibacter coralii]|uniref:pilus assembly protein n=1 Tax=Modicisalibacter coralii TaxID=2304602 RepID=UPI00100A5DB0|nr:PilC/PilY family type IV pilus protein [Halomonas coralii]